MGETPMGEHTIGETVHHWIIDDIDEEVATCEVDGTLLVRVPRWLLPREARPGGALRVRHRRDGAESVLAIELDLSRGGPLPMPDAPPPGRGDVTL
jgi:hypothetical protein